MNCCISSRWDQLHLGSNTPSWAGECSGNKSRSCDSDATLSSFSGKALIQLKNRRPQIQSDLERGVEKAMGWSEYDEEGLASLQVAAPLLVDQRRSPPPFLILLHQHTFSGVNRPTGRRSSSWLTRRSTFHVRNGGHPSVRGREERLCWNGAQSRAVGGQMTV